MNHFAARAGVDGSRLLSGSRFDYSIFGLGADVALVTPSLEAWSAEDARMLDILGSKGTSSPEGQALIKDIEAQFGAGNWYPEWVRLQDYYTAKYLAAESDAKRLAELQSTTTQQAAAMDPGQTYLPAGSVPYSVHDINAFAAMSAEEQASFINGFADGAAAAYFMMVAGNIKPEALTMIPPEYGGNKGVYVFNGVDYLTFEAWDAAVKASGQELPGRVTSVTTSTGEVITDPTRLENLTAEEVFGAPSQPATTWTPPPPPPPLETGGFYPATTDPSCAPGYVWDATLRQCVPMESPSMFPKPNGSAAPVVPSTALDVVDVTRTGTTAPVKGVPKNIDWNTALVVPQADGDPGDILPAPMEAGFGGGMIGMLALGGLALAVLAAPKRKR